MANQVANREDITHKEGTISAIVYIVTHMHGKDTKGVYKTKTIETTRGGKGLVESPWRAQTANST